MLVETVMKLFNLSVLMFSMLATTMQSRGYQTNPYEYFISPSFPSAPTNEIRGLFDCRMKLLSCTEMSICPGQTTSIPTTCILTPKHSWMITTKPNPDLPLLFQEESIADNAEENTRLYITISNISNQIVNIPQFLCVGFLLLKCA